MRSSERQRLLGETLHDSDYEKFRADTFAAGLRVFRSKQRRSRSWQPWALAAMITLLLALSLPLLRRTRHTTAEQNSHPGLPQLNVEIVQSVRDSRLEVETAHSATLETVETKRSPISEVNDEQLLALFAHRPVAFLRRGEKTEFIVLGN